MPRGDRYGDAEEKRQWRQRTQRDREDRNVMIGTRQKEKMDSDAKLVCLKLIEAGAADN